MNVQFSSFWKPTCCARGQSPKALPVDFLKPWQRILTYVVTPAKAGVQY